MKKAAELGDEKPSEQINVVLPLILPIQCNDSTPLYPTLTVALENANSTECDYTLAVKLHSVCLCYWPFLSSWFSRLPQIDLMKILQDYPSLNSPMFDIKIHWNFENITVNIPPLFALDAVVNAETGETTSLNPGSSPDLDALRPMLVLKDMTTFFKFGPSFNFVLFIDKSSLWFIPPLRSKKGSGRDHYYQESSLELESILCRALLRESREIIEIYLNETLDGIINRSAKIIDLNHFDLTYVSGIPNLSSGSEVMAILFRA